MSVAQLTIWKEEPLSPLSNEEVSWLSDDTFYQTSADPDEIKFEDDIVPCETKAEVASLMLENLENLINLDELIKEEPFLLDEKILPILDDVEPPRAVPVPLAPPRADYPPKAEYRPPDTHLLLREFETVYDAVEFTHETLTPPQSPPRPPVLATLEPMLAPPGGLYAPPGADIARELAAVDELVRARVEDLQWGAPPSPSSSSGEGSSDDPEWSPGPAEEPRGRKRAKPYSRGAAATADKKVRKKEQNKNAATRYRMKKKAEVEVILSEERQLCSKNTELEGKISDMQREIKYLKGLMRDLFKAKGLIN